jgi:hypothetical protein
MQERARRESKRNREREREREGERKHERSAARAVGTICLEMMWTVSLATTLTTIAATACVVFLLGIESVTRDPYQNRCRGYVRTPCVQIPK